NHFTIPISVVNVSRKLWRGTVSPPPLWGMRRDIAGAVTKETFPRTTGIVQVRPCVHSDIATLPTLTTTYTQHSRMRTQSGSDSQPERIGQTKTATRS